MKNKKIIVKGIGIDILYHRNDDYISLTDMVKNFGGDSIITNWLRNRNSIEFIGMWEQLNNSDFKPLEFEALKKQAGLNSFWISPKKWVETTNAIGLLSKSGRFGGGTFAHRDIAFEFASWLSPEFKLYLIKEFQRLKEIEENNLDLEWSLQRILTKVNYKIHTDAIKEKLIPFKLTKQQINYIYASEADVLNMALFGLTARQWRDNNKDIKGNVRDHATIEQLIILSNLESLNSVLIHQGLSQPDRLSKLNDIAIIQMTSLLKSNQVRKLK